mgnify:CR=1 FL=1
MRQEMRWERHFVPFTGKLSLLILLGLFIGLVGGWQIVDGMIDRIDAELGGGATVVATGGIARFVLPMCRHAIEYDRDLLLKGLALLYENNRREK